ncbi:hypothetical protein DFJ74DRAFT_229317 [Hyaloraphidium curvatum]|nr:hypothetical protein DFJ74DRAFT_229317 [Hyaloraphidium curvatum]
MSPGAMMIRRRVLRLCLGTRLPLWLMCYLLVSRFWVWRWPEASDHVRSRPTSISIITATMNRGEFLRRCLPSWRAAAHIEEILVVDWSSDPPFELDNDATTDPRVKVVRVDNETSWRLSWAFNLGARLARSEALLKLDADDCLDPNFVTAHPLPPGVFYRGLWKLARNENERHLNGALFLRRSDFLRVRGYDERIHSYGYDDDDMYQRLRRSGLAEAALDLDYIKHDLHDDSIRASDVKDRRMTFTDVDILVNQGLIEKLGSWTEAKLQSCGWTANGSSGGQILFVQKSISCPPTLADLAVSEVHEVTLNITRRVLGYSSAIPRTYIDSLDDLEHLNSLLALYYHNSRQRWIIVHVQHGLGNRLRALASAMALARATTRSLRVIWGLDLHMPVKFGDLFDLDPGGSPAIDFVYRFNELDVDPLRVDVYNYMEAEGGIKAQYINATSPKHIYVKTAYQLNHSSVSDDSVATELTQLRPKPEIHAMVQSVAAGRDLGKLVGVHVRSMAPDLEFEGVDKEYTPRDLAKLRRFRLACTHEPFIARLRNMNISGVFVSSDHPMSTQAFEAVFGSDSVVSLSESCSNRTLECLRTAVAELYLLASTSTILGSFWSSFTELARLLGRRPKTFEFACGASCPDGRIHLILQHDHIPDQGPGGDALLDSRRLEYEETLGANLRHPHIEAIHVLHESQQSVDYFARRWESQNQDPCGKIRSTLLGRRLTYSDVLRYAANLTDAIVLYVNADIQLGPGFEQVTWETLGSDEVLALTRDELDQTCNGTSLCDLYEKSARGFLSHDGFLFRSDAGFPNATVNELDFVPNLSGAENVVVHALKKAGFLLSNPCKSLKILHRHCSKVRRDANGTVHRDNWRRSDERVDVDRCGVEHCKDGWVFQGPTSFAQRLPPPASGRMAPAINRHFVVTNVKCRDLARDPPKAQPSSLLPLMFMHSAGSTPPAGQPHRGGAAAG